MAIELPDNFDKDDIEHFVETKIHEETEQLWEALKVLQGHVDANEGMADADREELKRVGDLVDGTDSE